MFEIDKPKFGSFVSQLRKEKGLTQKDLAQKLYISDKAISKWETGVSIPDVVLLIPLSEALGVTVTELLQCQRLENPEPMDKARVEELVKTAIAYSDEEQKANRPNRKKRLPVFIGFLVFASTACQTGHDQRSRQEHGYCFLPFLFHVFLLHSLYLAFDSTYGNTCCQRFIENNK